MQDCCFSFKKKTAINAGPVLPLISPGLILSSHGVLGGLINEGAYIRGGL